MKQRTDLDYLRCHQYAKAFLGSTVLDEIENFTPAGRAISGVVAKLAEHRAKIESEARK